MGFMRREIAAVRAGMYVLKALLEAAESRAVFSPLSVSRQASRMMTVGGKENPLSLDELEKIKTIAADGGLPCCPHCGHPEVEGDDPIILEDGILRNMQCERCENVWSNHYILVERLTG